MDALQEALESKDAIIHDALHEASEGQQEKGLGKDNQLKKQHHGSGKKQRQAGVAHGWMERAAILIQLLNDDEFEKAKEKAKYFELTFPAMQNALIRMQRNS